MPHLEPARILQVVTVMNRGGLETMLMNYYRQMDRARIQFDFMVHRSDEGDYDSEIIALGGRIHVMPQIRPGAYRRYFKRLGAFFRDHPEYRAVHAHINENSSFVLRAAREAGVPCRIAHSHLSDLGFDMKLPFRLYARMAMKDHPNGYFACSRKAGQWLFGRQIRGGEDAPPGRGRPSLTRGGGSAGRRPFGAPGQAGDDRRLIVLNNAVSVEEFAFNRLAREEVRAELRAGDRLVIGHIGRFTEQKNHDFLLDLFQAVRRRNPHSLLVLAGDGHLRPAIERKAQRLGLAADVRFLGVRSDIARLMQGMDLFLFPSLFEGLPVVLIEAQAAGLRCYASDAITKEADVTGRVRFLGLDKPPDVWADRMLADSCDHADTAELLRLGGYDVKAAAGWLADYYSSRMSAAAAIEGGNRP